MSIENVKSFLKKASEEKSIQEELAQKDADIVKIAASNGFDISAADIAKFAAQATVSLSDEELENAAGGFTPLTITVAYGIGTATIGVITALNCGK
jgi:predicted ribosomally synthesized peptide with nif11-like leader